MFTKKLETLYPQKNKFVSSALKITHETTSGNGAIKYSTSNNDFVDQFASIARYKEPRLFSEIEQDMNRLWSQDPLKCLKLAVYIRLITRKSVIESETLEDTQKGAGMRYEGIMRLVWIAINYPKVFNANIHIFIAAGSWKDLFEMLRIDLEYNGLKNHALNWNFFGKIIMAGLANEDTTHLVRKYMPQIRSAKARTTLHFQADTYIGKWFAHKLFGDDAQAYKNYRKMKSEGIAHTWQQKISKQLYNEIDFDKIAGRAIAQLVGGDFINKHGLTEKYSSWIKSKEKVGAKYTGFVFELFKDLRINTEDFKKDTINAQFKTICKDKISSKLLVVRDISGSMDSIACGCNMSSGDIAKAMALYFSESLTGEFKDAYMVFSTTCQMRKWRGKTPVDKWLNDTEGYFGTTDFQAAIDVLVKLRKQGVPESDFPEGLLLISDGEFDYYAKESNFQSAFAKLEKVFSKEFVDNFKIILWDIPNGYYGRKTTVFEDFADTPNSFHMSGYDGSVISFLLEGGEFKCTPKTNEELFWVAMDQELLNRVVIV